MKSIRTAAILVAAFATLITACSKKTASTDAVEEAPAASATLEIPFEKYTLENGLDVILHVDRSDPVVAIDLAVHVGSGREVPGRTGFAHLFEHLLFLDSENLGYGGLDRMNTRIGGDGTNGFTTNDMTQYFQAVPKDALEKIIWAEADKLGWFINTVSQNVVDNEKQVVKNEKRQRVDNQPYGHGLSIVAEAMYPEGHPYSWTVIGSLADLDAATLQDVKDFYARWYVPNNVTVTIAGDFDVADAKKWVEKYFGEIPTGEEIPSYESMPASLEESIDFFHEDNFATVPQLSLTWPAVEQYHPDAYALDILLEYLIDGKRAPLNEVMIDEDGVTSEISGFNYTKEIAGELYLFIPANAGEDIDSLIPSLEKAFARFEENGISQADVDRIKAGIEVSFYQNVQSALGKAISLGEYNVYTGDPAFLTTDIARLDAVTPEAVMDVYQRYIKDKPRISVSFVPKGEPELALEGSVKANVVEEQIVAGEGAPPDFDPAARVLEMRTPSSFDRTVEPPYGESYSLPDMPIWRAGLGNGISVIGTPSDETPLIRFAIQMDAGLVRGSVDKPAVPQLTAEMLEKGTKRLTTAEFEDAVQSLGSSISVNSGSWGTTVYGVTLRRNFDATMALVAELVNEPRWDEEEFALLKSKAEQQIAQIDANPNAIARREQRALRYPADNVLHYTGYGPADKLADVTIDDLKAFHQSFYRWDTAKLLVVGDYDEASIKAAFADMPVSDAAAPEAVVAGAATPVDEAALYFYDVPGAKQSVLRIERPSLDASSPDFLIADAINLQLGGIYTSNLNSTLRVEKGYTYGIRSGFNVEPDRGFFQIGTSVRTNVTRESLALIREIVGGYGDSFNEAQVEELKGAVLRGQALANETLSDKARTIDAISRLGLPDSYLRDKSAAIEALDLESFQAFTKKYLTPDAMRYLVIGDASTQAEGLDEIGIGELIMINGE
ncbi:MAG: pitrilysin family protein [Pseudomonadota bacterium]